MESIPGYVSIVFILTTFITVGFLLQATKAAGIQSWAAKLLLFLLPLWIIFQSILSIGGFYNDVDSTPPRIFIFGVVPALALIAVYFLFFRSSFIDRLPLKLLTSIHSVRIPVELVLYWLFLNQQVPKIMTFSGWNFDILTGIMAIVLSFVAFRGGSANRPILIAFNVIGLFLLALIVIIAFLSAPSPLQSLAFEQPNRAVLFFPYSFLPTIVVPIILFSHLASLWKLATEKAK